MDLSQLNSILDAIPTNAELAFELADALIEHGDLRGELLRLSYQLRTATPITSERIDKQRRLQQLLSAGVRPLVPTYANALGMTFSFIPPCTILEPGNKNETGQRGSLLVSTKGFYLAATPVTQAQWQEVMKYNPSFFFGTEHPVECVSWGACIDFCRSLADMTGKPIRLPKEVEWECACRAGTSTEYHSGDGVDALNRAGWYQGNCEDGNSEGGTKPVGQKLPNAWGLYDMHGNVQEWCQDICSDNSEDGLGAQWRILRGGAWGRPASECRSASSRCYPADEVDGWNFSIGCRVCFSL